MTKIGGGAKGEASHTGRMRNEPDKASADFGHNPKGWREFCPRVLSHGLPIFAIWAAPRFAP